MTNVFSARDSLTIVDTKLMRIVANTQAVGDSRQREQHSRDAHLGER